MPEYDPNATAGWYPDAHDSTRERYWDGATWTDQYRVHPSVIPASSQAGPTPFAVVAAILALLVAPLGLVLGVAVLGSTRGGAMTSTRILGVVAVTVGLVATAAIAAFVTLGIVGANNAANAARIAAFCGAYDSDPTVIDEVDAALERYTFIGSLDGGVPGEREAATSEFSALAARVEAISTSVDGFSDPDDLWRDWADYQWSLSNVADELAGDIHPSLIFPPESGEMSSTTALLCSSR